MVVIVVAMPPPPQVQASVTILNFHPPAPPLPILVRVHPSIGGGANHHRPPPLPPVPRIPQKRRDKKRKRKVKIRTHRRLSDDPGCVINHPGHHPIGWEVPPHMRQRRTHHHRWNNNRHTYHRKTTIRIILIPINHPSKSFIHRPRFDNSCHQFHPHPVHQHRFLTA